jgi:5S rRNA maturation endonuclease (ribonuclease M5)
MADKQVLDALASQFGVNLGAPRQAIVCPFHKDERPSCTIYLAPMGEEHVHCFSCGWHGGLARFIATARGISTSQLLHDLGIKRNSKVAALENVATTFQKAFEDGGETLLTSGEKMPANEWMAQNRGHDEKILKRFMVGVATEEAMKKILEDNDKKDIRALKLLDNRKKDELLVPLGAIIFPVMIAGEVVGLRWKRYSNHKAVDKQIGQMEKGGWVRFTQILNYDALNHEGNELWIVEGEDDIMRLEAQGAPTTGFPGKTSPRDKRLNKLKACPAEKIIVGTDNDESGEQSRKNIVKFLQKEKKTTYVYTPQMKDVADDLDMFSIDDLRAGAKQAVVEFRESGGAYWDGNFKLSTFTFELKAKIIGETEIYLVLEIKGEKEPTPQTIIIPNRLIADKGEFNRFLKKFGCYNWLAAGNSLDEIITRKWSEKMPVHHAITYIGVVHLDEYDETDKRRVHVMHDRMMLPDGKEEGSDGGIFWLGKKRGLFLDVANRFSFTTEGIVASTSRLKDIKEILWIPEYAIAFGWFLAIPWMSEIQESLGGFPMLWLTGEKESGKTTFASFLMGLFYPLQRLKETIDAFISPARTTPEGLSLALSRYSGLPVLFDDLRANSRYIEEFLETFRVLYDRFTIQKGKLRGKDSLRQEYEMRKLRAALVVTSQHPPEDEAVSQRTLEVDFKRTQLKGEVLAKMRAVVKELYPIGLYFISESLNHPLKPELDKAMSLLGPEVVSSRKMQAFAVSCAGLFKAGFSDGEVKRIIDKLSVSHQRFVDDTDEVEDFFDYIRTASSKVMEIQKFIGWKDEGMWLAPSQLYDLTKSYHGGRAAFTRRSIKKLLMAQDGAVPFKTPNGITKEKPIGVKVQENKWTTVRAVFFRHGSKMGKRIKKLLAHEDVFMVEDHEEAPEEGQGIEYDEEREKDPFDDQF